MDVYQQYFTILLYLTCVGLRLIYWRIPLEKARSYDGKNYHFSHPIFIFAVIYLVQLFSGVYFLAHWAILSLRKKKRIESSEEARGHVQRITAGNLNFKFRIFILPATFQFISFACTLIGQTLIQVGTSDSLEAISILLIPILCRLTLRMKFHEHYWRGAFLVFIGYVLVAAGQKIVGEGKGYIHGTILLKKDTLTRKENLTTIEAFINSPEGIFTGCTVLILGAFAASTYKIMVQWYLQSQDIPPLIANSCLGFFGTTLSFATMAPAYFITVNPFSSNPDGSFENIISVYYKLTDNKTLLGYILGLACMYMLYMSAFTIILKERHALTAEIVYYSSSSISIAGKMFSENYRNSIHWLVGVGGFIIVIGSLVYFDLIIKHIFNWCMKQAQCDVQNTQVELDKIFSDDSIEQLQRTSGAVNTLRLRDLVIYY